MIWRVAAALCLAALVATGARAAGGGSVSAVVVANPLALSLAVVPAQVGLGGSATATATATNLGVVPLAAGTVTLRADPVGLSIGGGATQTVTLAPGSTAVSWGVCGLGPGTYLLLASARAGAFGAESSARLLTVSSTLASTCPEEVAAQAVAGSTVTTDVEGDGSTRPDPLETWVTTAMAGAVSIAERPIAPPAPNAFTFLGQEAGISAPQGTAAAPLVLVFRLDASLVSTGRPLQVFRNGVLVAGCPGDPCVSSRSTRADGDVELAVQTRLASTWTFGGPIMTRGLVGGALQPASGGAALFGAASDGSRVEGALEYRRGTTSFFSRGTVALAIAANGRSAWLAGTAADGRTYLAYLEDNGRNGRGDRFRLWVGGTLQTGDGKLADGDVRIER